MISSQPLPSLIDITWLSQHMDDPNLIILDASIPSISTSEKERLHLKTIPNALFFDLKKVFSNQSAVLPNTIPSPEDFESACRVLGIANNSKIVLYDDKGIYSSPRAWFLFKLMGFTNVSILDGGLPAWIESGLLTKNSYRSFPKKQGDFKTNFKPELVVTADQVLKAIKDSNYIIIDARSYDRFTGVTPEPRNDIKGGHIPSSVNIPYTKLIKDGKLIYQAELAKLVHTFKSDQKHTIFTCGSGITACILMFAFECAGHTNSSLYDGSWTEWGQLPDIPIVKKAV
ncbi:sulfurtransferase [Aquimarina sp. W85]|uniref:sulfurtransferase n=1 Tax=Aquimarina rhodophyticola TaxID=3342246 RepID=UPI00366C9126